MLTDNVRSKLSALSRRLEEIDRMLAAPETAADMNLFRDLSRERGEIEPIVGRLHAYERAESDLAAAQELAADPEMKAFAAEESAAATHELERIEQELRIALLPKDPNDDRNIFWKFAPARAETNQHSLRVTCCACICAMPKGTVGKRKSSPRTKASWADTKKLSCALSAEALIQNSNSSLAAIACSASRLLSRKGVFTLQPAQ